MMTEDSAMLHGLCEPIRFVRVGAAEAILLETQRSGARRAAEPIEAAHEVADPGSPDPVEVLMRREAVQTVGSRGFRP